MTQPHANNNTDEDSGSVHAEDIGKHSAEKSMDVECSNPGDSLLGAPTYLPPTRRRGRPKGSKNKPKLAGGVQKKRTEALKTVDKGVSRRGWNDTQEDHLVCYWEDNFAASLRKNKSAFARDATAYINSKCSGDISFVPFDTFQVANKLMSFRSRYTTLRDKLASSGYGLEDACTKSMRDYANSEFRHFERIDSFMASQNNIAPLELLESGVRRDISGQELPGFEKSLESGEMEEEDEIQPVGMNAESVSAVGKYRRHSDSSITQAKKKAGESLEEMAQSALKKSTASRSTSRREELLAERAEAASSRVDALRNQGEVFAETMKLRAGQKDEELSILKSQTELQREQTIQMRENSKLNNDLALASQLRDTIKFYKDLGKEDEVEKLLKRLNALLDRH